MHATITPVKPESIRELLVNYFKNFGVLKETRFEYWGIQIVNLLDSTAYFSLLTIASVFLSEDLGFDDRAAGYTITVFTAATSLMLLFSGMLTDWLGIRRSLNITLGGQLILRLAMVWVGLTPSLPHRGLLAITGVDRFNRGGEGGLHLPLSVDAKILAPDYRPRCSHWYA